MTASTAAKRMRRGLDSLYRKYSRRDLVHPDPVGFLYAYDDPDDREVVALIAACLAYGRVAQIHRSIERVLEPMGRPAAFLRGASKASLLKGFGSFRHRFTSGEELALLLYAIKRVRDRFGSLQTCFVSGFGPRDETVVEALGAFVRELAGFAGGTGSSLLACPSKGSACKRLNLFLRWMVRTDAVDPGGWSGVPTCALVVPLDTHLHRIGLSLGFTRKKQANLRAALEVTEGFRRICPQDPVRYDFCLTRLGIKNEPDQAKVLARLGRMEVA